MGQPQSSEVKNRRNLQIDTSESSIFDRKDSFDELPISAHVKNLRAKQNTYKSDLDRYLEDIYRRNPNGTKNINKSRPLAKKDNAIPKTKTRPIHATLYNIHEKPTKDTSKPIQNSQKAKGVKQNLPPTNVVDKSALRGQKATNNPINTKDANVKSKQAGNADTSKLQPDSLEKEQTLVKAKRKYTISSNFPVCIPPTPISKTDRNLPAKTDHEYMACPRCAQKIFVQPSYTDEPQFKMSRNRDVNIDIPRKKFDTFPTLVEELEEMECETHHTPKMMTHSTQYDQFFVDDFGERSYCNSVQMCSSYCSHDRFCDQSDFHNCDLELNHGNHYEAGGVSPTSSKVSIFSENGNNMGQDFQPHLLDNGPYYENQMQSNYNNRPSYIPERNHDAPSANIGFPPINRNKNWNDMPSNERRYTWALDANRIWYKQYEM